MDILFDHQSFSRQATGGVSRSYVELARALNQHSGSSAQILAPIHWNQYLCESQNKDFSSGIYQQRAVFRLWKQRWWFNHMITNLWCRFTAPDIIHETWYSIHPYQLPKKTRVAITVHDMIYQVHPEWTPDAEERARELAASVDRAAVIFCDSEYTRNDLLNWRESLDPQKVFVVHLTVIKPGANELSPENSWAKAPHLKASAEILNSPFFLYVGQRSATHKNFPFLAKAFAASGLQKEHNLICFGGGEFTDSEKRLFREIGLSTDRVYHIPHNDSLLGLAYKNAVAFIYPSLYEGFGLPPLEAMGYDCPVLSANATCIPEIGGDAAVYFSPTDQDDLVNSLRRISQSEALRKDLVHKGRVRFERYSGEVIAKQALEAYQSAF
jgi:glycosyltransferase involved in cell wall biosynthesis